MLVEGLGDDAAELGCAAELDLVEDLLGGRQRGAPAARHWERHHDLSKLVGEMIADSRA